jgi:hypothetical protein
MGPFETPLGTQWDDGRAWKHEMFPSEDVWSRFAERGVRKFPQMGDISCRSALTIHRGTTHRSPIARPVLVLGVDAPGAGHDKLHDLMVTQDYYDALPPSVRDHLVCRRGERAYPGHAEARHRRPRDGSGVGWGPTLKPWQGRQPRSD